METAGPVGLVVVGLGGVGTSLLTGILAARAHLVHPFGSLVEAGGTGRSPNGGLIPLRDQAPFAELGDLVLGAFEIREDDAYRAALRAGLVNRSLVDELRPELRKIQAMLGGREAPTRRHLADAIAEDLRGFLAHHRCSRGVVICTIPGLSIPPAKCARWRGSSSTALPPSPPARKSAERASGAGRIARRRWGSDRRGQEARSSSPWSCAGKSRCTLPPALSMRRCSSSWPRGRIG